MRIFLGAVSCTASNESQLLQTDILVGVHSFACDTIWRDRPWLHRFYLQSVATSLQSHSAPAVRLASLPSDAISVTFIAAGDRFTQMAFCLTLGTTTTVLPALALLSYQQYLQYGEFVGPGDAWRNPSIGKPGRGDTRAVLAFITLLTCQLR